MRFQMLISSAFLLVQLLLISDLGIGFTSSVAGQCLEDQKGLLLELRSNLTYDSSLSTKLVRWNESTDCCQWEGVACNARGHVLGLDLSNESISGGISDAGSSLFRLQSLQSLNLAQNALDSVEFPSGFGKLTGLRYLNLSSSFTGQIPADISNLIRLLVLDVSVAYSSVTLENPNLERLIQTFSQLEELYLDGVNASAVGHAWCTALSSSVPNLRILSMPNAYLTGPFDFLLLKLRSLSTVRLDGNTFSTVFPEFFADFPKLQVLSMSSCDLYGVVPQKIFQVESLEKVDLNNNRELGGSLPDQFPLNGSLQILQLQYTNFSGNLPESIGSLRMLSTVDLRACNFSGSIPSSIKNLSHLVHLDLSVNQFVGYIPSFALLKNLELINLRSNHLTGRIPASLWEGLEHLNFLDLSENSLEGEIPASLFALPSLKDLDLSNNTFYGLIRESGSGSSSQLQSLRLHINKLEGPIPKFFFHLENLIELSLSSNKFNGSLDLTDFRKLSALISLDLSHNNLSVNITENVSLSSLFPKLETLMLASCKMQKLPPLKNQSSLSMLDLSDNQLQGEIPNWLWEVNNGLLRFLNLSHNQLTHLQEPYNLRSVYLDYLDLHSNLLRGQIPSPPNAVAYLDLSSNDFSSSIPANIGNSLTRALFVSMANNRIIGKIPPSLCNATQLRVLDLSNNSLQARIPSCLSGESSRVLNLRRNKLSGDIPDRFPIGCGLETLDLSWNALQGKVPRSLERCTELEVLNLGNNQLNDTFPCWLKNLTRLRVLVLRFNKFHGDITCLREKTTWLNLQIIDIGSNDFDGTLPANLFAKLSAFMVDEDGMRQQADYLYFSSVNVNNIYYQDSVTLNLKGKEVELLKILTVFTSIDFSENHFQGRIPDTIGELKSLYVLNFSHNALSGHIPASMENLKHLGSLDLSFNSLGGEIPEQLASLTFLSSLNLSYNHLVGRIPRGSQMQTFPESSFIGNDGLCGFPLNKTCSDSNTPAALPQPASEGEHEAQDTGLYVSAALGFIFGATVIFGPLVLSKRWRKYYNRQVNNFILVILCQQDKNKDW